ncbi:major capsid protein [uncultured Caudovirales phage]|uniref:Major capsid protein n=1 Tax=uncultured Caudovirales phage TaxID=2100421 RepID=A0A6J5NSY0_9CAUD|nr:major capsid protein [uncultured Caudovirales phage]
MYLAEEIQNKWAPVLDHDALGTIRDQHRRSVTAIMLENTEKALMESGAHGSYQTLTETSSVLPANFMGASSSTAGAGGIDTFDPVLISLVRRAMPNLIAYDICGVQPMTGPTGLIFAMRSRYANQAGDETFYNEVNTSFSSVVSGANTFGQKFVGTIPGATNTSPLTAVNTYNTGSGMSTAQAEALGTDSNSAFPQMAFSIEKVTVTAKSRALKAEYTMELAQDLKAIHGLDAETELANILSAEILAEINREVVRTINITAEAGAQDNTTTAGVFDLDTDSNGRWSVEKFKGLMFQLEREANQIAKQTRRGKGNIVICSSDVASALQMAGVLDYAPALNSNNLQVDDTGNTFAGVLNGRLKVYIDPYSLGGNYLTVGYKGSSAFDAGIFYCPYVPLQMVRAVDQASFQPKIGFKTRYGMVANPFAQGLTAGSGALTINTNKYYRRVIVNNLM